MFEIFQRTVNVNDDRAGNVGHPRVAVTEVNVVVQKVIQQRPRDFICHVAVHAGLRRMSLH